MRKPASKIRRERHKLASRRHKFRGLMRNSMRDELKAYDCHHVNESEAEACTFCYTWDPDFDDLWGSDDFDTFDLNFDRRLKPLQDLADQLIHGRLFRHRPLIQVASVPVAGPIADEDLGAIEQRLCEHWWNLHHHYDNVGLMNAIFHKLPGQLGQRGAAMLLKLNRTERALAVLFSPFWVRSMTEVTHKISNDPCRLFEHLFVREHVVAGGVCHHFQFEQDDLINPQGLLWTILVGSQASLFRASKLFGWPIHAKTQYYVEQTLRAGWPQQYTGYEDCSSDRLVALAEVQRMGATPEQAATIVGTIGYVSFARQKRDNEYHQYWSQVACWLASNLQRIPIEDQTFVLDWIYHQMTEVEHHEICLKWQPRSINRLVEEARDYQQQILRPTPTVLQHWKKLGFSWKWVEGETQWTMEELTSTAELAQEGQKLHHCVASYSGRCVAGVCVILSLKKDGERCLTVEYDPNLRMIMQARGLCNRAASNKEWTVLDRWLSAVRQGK